MLVGVSTSSKLAGGRLRRRPDWPGGLSGTVTASDVKTVHVCSNKCLALSASRDRPMPSRRVAGGFQPKLGENGLARPADIRCGRSRAWNTHDRPADLGPDREGLTVLR